MIARVFPPFQSTGHSIRVAKFIKYLPALGWLPSVLTIDDRREYESDRRQGSQALLSEIGPEVTIHRTNAGEPSWTYLERERAFGQRNSLTKLLVKIFGGARRWGFRNFVVPDRSLLWLPFAVRRGRQIVKNEHSDVIFATCPPHSAALIGALLKRITWKPMILDFRDDWIDTPWHRSRPAPVRMIHRWMEKWAVTSADKVVLVTEWSRLSFIRRYPTQAVDKFTLIPNGCDLEDFAALAAVPTGGNRKTFTIVHAGAMNDSQSWGRDPEGLFRAVRDLIRLEPALAERLTVIFAGDLTNVQQRLANEMGLSSVIKGIGHLPHNSVLNLMKSADLLLAINYENWSTIIPAKIYEYWAIGGPPVLLLSCPGAAADFVKEHKLGLTVEPHDADGIRQAIAGVLRQSETLSPMRVATDGIESFDRKTLAVKLAEVLTTIA
ncbi:MAG: glycosyl transferase family 1 [Gemmatimonadetes bacterium]|nr:glycosyl transferase family 1 [Gemmatimonadota bacterium]